LKTGFANEDTDSIKGRLPPIGQETRLKFRPAALLSVSRTDLSQLSEYGAT
jgi:hypothetical protein